MSAGKAQKNPKAVKNARKKKKTDKLTSLLLILILMAGLSLLLYPKFSNWWNSFHQSQAIASYSDAVAELDNTKNEEIMAAAHAYNDALSSHPVVFKLTEEEAAEYAKVLDITGTGIMGYVEIPSIKVSLPIYHGTSDGVLQIAAGHLDWTNLPIGGVGNHSVISAHRGLPSAKLFTDLDRLVEGDTFLIRVLDQIYTYEVDQILIVLPSDVQALVREPDKDYCTLETCTPYGINTHRMLVRGHRIENAEEAKVLIINNEATLIDPRLVTGALAMPILFVLLLITTFSDSRARRRRRIMREFRRR